MPKRTTDAPSPFYQPARVTLRHAVAAGHTLSAGTLDKDRDLATVAGVSGDECARTLERCGMARCDEAAGVVWMEAGSTFVAVPRCNSLPAETLADILATSGLSTGDFVEQLNRLRRRSAPSS